MSLVQAPVADISYPTIMRIHSTKRDPSNTSTQPARQQTRLYVLLGSPRLARGTGREQRFSELEQPQRQGWLAALADRGKLAAKTVLKPCRQRYGAVCPSRLPLSLALYLFGVGRYGLVLTTALSCANFPRPHRLLGA